MELSVLLPKVNAQRWDCHGCTNCCRELVVHLTARDVEQIDRQNWTGRIDGAPYVRLGRETVLNHKPAPGGGCVFLSQAGRCRIHEEFGASAKPLACRLYPFSLHREDDALAAALRFDCPSAVRNEGAPLDTHRKSVKSLAGEFSSAAPELLGRSGRSRPLYMVAGREMTGRERDALDTAMLDAIETDSLPLNDWLLRLAALHETLAQARLGRIRDERFVELLRLLVSEASERSSQSSQEPTERQVRILRMTVFAHCEYLSLEQARRSWFAGLRHRFDQLRRARRLAAGVGGIPSLVAGCRGGTIADLSRVTMDSRAGEAMSELLSRYLAARIRGRTVYGPGYYDWPALDGVAALLLDVCCIDWLAAYLAMTDGRGAYALEDVRGAVAAVDRTAGRSPELGARSAALRIRYLVQTGGVRALLTAARWAASL